MPLLRISAAIKIPRHRVVTVVTTSPTKPGNLWGAGRQFPLERKYGDRQRMTTDSGRTRTLMFDDAHRHTAESISSSHFRQLPKPAETNLLETDSLQLRQIPGSNMTASVKSRSIRIDQWINQDSI